MIQNVGLGISDASFAIDQSETEPTGLENSISSSEVRDSTQKISLVGTETLSNAKPPPDLRTIYRKICVAEAQVLSELDELTPRSKVKETVEKQKYLNNLASLKEFVLMGWKFFHPMENIE